MARPSGKLSRTKANDEVIMEESRTNGESELLEISRLGHVPAGLRMAWDEGIGHGRVLNPARRENLFGKGMTR